MTWSRALLAILLLGGCRAPEVSPDLARHEPLALASAGPAPTTDPATTDASAAGQRRDAPPEPSASVSAIAPALASAPGAPTPPASAAPKGPCEITITALLEAEVFRGVRRSPMREQTMERLSPDERSRWHGRDHGVTYLQCRYAVSMNHRPFIYEHVAGQGMLFDHKLDPARCSDPAEKRKVEVDLRQTTRQCTDPHAGAYWGFDLREAR